VPARAVCDILFLEDEAMENSTLTEPTPSEAARMSSEIDKLIARMTEADARIAKYQEETAKLRAETRAMIATLGTGSSC
jgi:hypothetical protein